MLKKLITIIMLLSFVGCGHYLIETEPFPQKKSIPRQTVKQSPQKAVEKKTIDRTQDQINSKVQTADSLLFEGKHHLAYNEYMEILRMDPQNIPARMGLSKCYLKDNHFDLAFSSLQTIKNEVHNTRYAPEYYFLVIQTSISQTHWDNTQLIDIENAYYHALPAYRNKPGLYYYMALIYKKYFQYNRAKTLFSKVLSFQGAYSDSAYEMINQIKSLEQCDACDYHQKLPLIPQLSRADICYILHHELEIYQLFQQYTNKDFKPQPQRTSDISDHPLKREIEALLSINLKRLSLFSDNGFEPKMPLTRADFAQILFEIVGQIYPRAIDAFQLNKQKDAITDIQPTQHFYRAIVFCTRHLIMLPLENKEFDPYGPVSGADALMSIRTLKQYFVQHL